MLHNRRPGTHQGLCCRHELETCLRISGEAKSYHCGLQHTVYFTFLGVVHLSQISRQTMIVSRLRMFCLKGYIMCTEIFSTFMHRFSGLTAEDFMGVETTLSNIQGDLLALFSAETILIGHSLESDLRALKVNHFSSLRPLRLTDLFDLSCFLLLDHSQLCSGHCNRLSPQTRPALQESTQNTHKRHSP